MKRKIHRSFLVLILSFAIIIGHMSTILQNKSILSVGIHQSTRTIVLATARGTIYDRNRIPLNNTGLRYCGALIPELKQLNRIKSDMSDSEYQRLKNELKQQHLLVATLTKASYTSPKLCTFQVPVRYDEQAIHSPLLGTLDESGLIGQSGIEKSYNAILNHYSGKISITYPVNGVGDCQSDGTLKVSNTMNRCQGGVQLTIDKTIQQLLNNLVKKHLQEGSVFILDTKTSELLAYSHTSSLDSPDASNFKHLLSQQDCNLADKIVIAATAMESGLTAEQSFLCTGQLTIGNTVFSCTHPLGHHLLDLHDAFTHNCSLYFIQLAQRLGDTALYKTAKALGLYDPIELAKGITADGATPNEQTNSFLNQKDLTISPLHLTQLAATIANGGTLNAPAAVLGTVNEKGKLTPAEQGGGAHALSERTATALKQILGQNIVNDTDNNLWFTGLTSQYVITILSENSAQNQQDLQKFYREIINLLL